MKFKPGDLVRVLYDGVYYYGEVTIVSTDGKYKVLFNDLNYDYYEEEDLELVKEEDLIDD